jgi:hypothetical protein
MSMRMERSDAMATRTTGSRPITIDGVHYRWRIRNRWPRNPQRAYGYETVTVAVERTDGPGRVLLMHTTHPHPEGTPPPFIDHPLPVGPRIVASGIRQALAGGWALETRGGPFVFRAETLDLFAPMPPTVVTLAESLQDGADCAYALHDALLECGCIVLAEHFRHHTQSGCWATDAIFKNRCRLGPDLSNAWL